MEKFIKTGQHFPDPSINDVVFVRDFKDLHQKGGYFAIITDGAYLQGGRVSNFFWWKKINEDYTVAEEVLHGYGCFEWVEKNYRLKLSIGFKDEKPGL